MKSWELGIRTEIYNEYPGLSIDFIVQIMKREIKKYAESTHDEIIKGVHRAFSKERYSKYILDMELKNRDIECLEGNSESFYYPRED